MSRWDIVITNHRECWDDKINKRILIMMMRIRSTLQKSCWFMKKEKNYLMWGFAFNLASEITDHELWTQSNHAHFNQSDLNQIKSV